VREQSGVTLNDAQLDKLIAWQGRWVDKNATVDKVDTQYYLASGTVEAGQHLVNTGTRLSLVTAEPIAPGRDVAVMKADVSSVPALPLATGQPSVGAATYVVGYPRRGYLEEAAQLDATVSPALTSGTLQGPRTMDGGWTAFGTSAQVAHGNSGGPVLDRQGRVLGVVSFAISTDPQGEALGEGFFVPADVIRETLDKASVKLPERSPACITRRSPRVISATTGTSWRSCRKSRRGRPGTPTSKMRSARRKAPCSREKTKRHRSWAASYRRAWVRWRSPRSWPSVRSLAYGYGG
jgi:hypothetical protein